MVEGAGMYWRKSSIIDGWELKKQLKMGDKKWFKLVKAGVVWNVLEKNHPLLMDETWKLKEEGDWSPQCITNRICNKIQDDTEIQNTKVQKYKAIEIQKYANSKILW